MTQTPSRSTPRGGGIGGTEGGGAGPVAGLLATSPSKLVLLLALVLLASGTSEHGSGVGGPPETDRLLPGVLLVS